MLKQKPRRKFLYPIGLLSLSILPLLCLDSFYQQYLKKKSLYALEVTYWDPLGSANEKFTKIILTGAEEDKIKLDYAQVAIRELIHQKDTTRGMELTFSDNAKYSSLVKLFDLCRVENVRSYVNYQNKFWVFNLWPSEEQNRQVEF